MSEGKIMGLPNLRSRNKGILIYFWDMQIARIRALELDESPEGKPYQTNEGGEFQ